MEKAQVDTSFLGLPYFKWEFEKARWALQMLKRLNHMGNSRVRGWRLRMIES